MPVILETISWILKNVNVGVDRLIVGYGVRFVYSESSQVGSNPHSPLPPYVPPGPIAPLLLRQARILASLLHANHSCL